MTYRLSRNAEDDVIQIYVTGVTEFGVDQAERYHEGLERAFAFLSDFPLAAPERAELKGSIRVHPYRSHIIIYRLDGADVLIQRVRHAGEDWLGRTI
ncbi:MAG: type II toxin-antitoxin system RelE/ParE family toxin [Gemmatimonadaceae bacterium]|nr:type II toxin-antitoxin system RelE/ParE family toxin [Caulobacter sp.]